MNRSDLLAFMRREKYAVEASVSPAGPQAALVGIVVGDAFELVFDTLDATRKARNLRADPRVAFVVGGTGASAEQTVQYAGIADEPSGAELDRLKQLYFARFPEGPTRASWKGITYFRVRPTWLRFSDFREEPPFVIEFTGADLTTLR
ncbi:MAG: pyridoxamine 5'-phosphate oxidase family protein [Acidobacteriota bacterium]